MGLRISHGAVLILREAFRLPEVAVLHRRGILMFMHMGMLVVEGSGRRHVAIRFAHIAVGFAAAAILLLLPTFIEAPAPAAAAATAASSTCAKLGLAFATSGIASLLLDLGQNRLCLHYGLAGR